MMVVWHHATAEVAMAPVFGKIPTFGPLGVDLFFGISGFIMLVTTWDKPIGPAEFMAHRIKRIVPLYWLATLSMVGLAVVAPALFKTLKWDAATLTESLLFIPHYSLSFPGDIKPLLVPGWSLHYEMFFYVLFAGALLCKREYRADGHGLRAYRPGRGWLDTRSPVGRAAGLYEPKAAGIWRRDDSGKALGNEEACAAGLRPSSADGIRRCVLFDLPIPRVHAGAGQDGMEPNWRSGERLHVIGVDGAGAGRMRFGGMAALPDP